MISRAKACALRALIEKASASLADEDALGAVELFPLWHVGIAYEAGQRIRYGDRLYRCVVSHASQAGWEPPATPALWTEVAKPGEIPVWKQPTGAQDAYMIGDKVWYPEKDTTVYRSTIDNNVWSPADYTAGWEVVE
jgi:hypothetical protein